MLAACSLDEICCGQPHYGSFRWLQKNSMRGMNLQGEFRTGAAKVAILLEESLEQAPFLFYGALSSPFELRVAPLKVNQRNMALVFFH
jgi:hypothetical protein